MTSPKIMTGARLVRHHRHHRRPFPSEAIAAEFGPATGAALDVQQAMRVLATWRRLEVRDRAAGRPPSSLLAERIDDARQGVVNAEHRLRAVQAVIATTYQELDQQPDEP